MIRRRPASDFHRAPAAPGTHRAFTILELLVVLALLIAVAALVFPNVQAFLGPQRIDSAATEVENAIALARGDAIREGRVRLVAVIQTKEESTIVSAAVEPGLALSVLRTDEDPPPLSLRTAAVLSPSITIRPKPGDDAEQGAGDPLPPAAGNSPGTPAADPAMSSTSPQPTRQVLALCFADGTVLTDRPIEVIDAAGAGFQLSINRWTGAVQRAAIAPTDADTATPQPEPADTIEAPPQTRPDGPLDAPSSTPGDALPTTRTGPSASTKTGARPRRGNPRRGAGRVASSTRASVLLETLAAVSIFVVAGVAVLGAMDRAIAAEERARRRDQAMDLARSAMSMVEAGVLSVESIDGPVRGWSGPAGAGDGEPRGGPFLGEAIAPAQGGMYNDDLPEASGWELRVKTAPSAFPGLTTVEISAFLSADGAEMERVTLRQLVRLGERNADRAGAEDESFGGTAQERPPRGGLPRSSPSPTSGGEP